MPALTYGILARLAVFCVINVDTNELSSSHVPPSITLQILYDCNSTVSPLGTCLSLSQHSQSKHINHKHNLTHKHPRPCAHRRAAADRRSSGRRRHTSGLLEALLLELCVDLCRESVAGPESRDHLVCARRVCAPDLRRWCGVSVQGRE